MIPNKNKDQHIMLDSGINEQVVDAASIIDSDKILEVGGGPGNLTELLAKRAKFVYTVEKDKKYFSMLRKKFAGSRNVKVISGNILEVELPEFDKIISNPPYSILQSFFFRLVKENKQNFKCSVMVAPHKFTKLVTSDPENPNFGVLSALFYAFYDVEVIAEVPKKAFDPKPRVTSHIIRITQKKNADFISSILQNLFSDYKKKARNALLDIFWNSSEGIIHRKLTRKEAKALILRVEEKTGVSLLDKNIFQLSNAEIKNLSKALLSIHNI
jgi:16S rRNA (adenine1518-N6/adenine1519-N6)-dimethyltransferase